MGVSVPRVAALHIYPVKSAFGCTLSEAAVESEGLAGDRRFVITTPEGDFVTARSLPRIVRVHTGLEDPSGGDPVLSLRTPGLPDFVWTPKTGTRKEWPVRVWKDTFPAFDCGDSAADWISAALEGSYRLFWLGKSNRPLRWDRRRRVSFADAAPVLGLSRESVAELGVFVGEDFEYLRFRPNIVFEGAEAFAEDGWKRIRVGDVEFLVMDGCSRCEFTTLDPHSGEAHPRGEPLASLRRFRANDTGVYFGANLLPIGSGKIRVGDTVEVLERKPALRFAQAPSVVAVVAVVAPKSTATAKDTFALLCTGRGDISETLSTFTLRRVDGKPFGFAAGQYLSFLVPLGEDGIRRAYSICSAPSQDTEVEIAVRRVEGGRASPWLHENLRPGTRLNGGQIEGTFTLLDHPWNSYLFLAAGSGITPFLSQISWISETQAPVDVVLHYSAPGPQALFGLERIRNFQDRLGTRLRVHVSYTRESVGETATIEGGLGHGVQERRGRLDAQTLFEIAPDLRDRRILACGPPDYRRNVQNLLDSMGVKIDRRYHEEVFGEHSVIRPDPGSVVPGTVTLAKSGKSVACDGTQDLLKVVEGAGLELPFSCRSGDCGSCRVRVLSGTAQSTTPGSLLPTEREEGWVLACSTFPKGDVELEI